MDQDQIRQALAQEAARLAAMRDDVQTSGELDVDEQMAGGGELSTVDNHPADIATEQVSREVNLSFLEQIDDELGDVEHALERLAAGTYGTCEACSRPIGEERLKELPATRFCIDDARARDEQVASTFNG